MATQNYSEMGANQSGLWLRLGNRADYSVYVHEGTTGPIWGDSGYMLLGKQSPTGPGYPRFMLITDQVSGQDAQPWMAQSLTRILNLNRFYATSTAIRAGA